MIQYFSMPIPCRRTTFCSNTYTLSTTLLRKYLYLSIGSNEATLSISLGWTNITTSFIYYLLKNEVSTSIAQSGISLLLITGSSLFALYLIVKKSFLSKPKHLPTRIFGNNV